MFNPTKIFKIKSTLNAFQQNHPKFVKFLEAVHKNAIEEGTIIEVNVTTASGKSLNSNVKLTTSDLELFRELSELMSSK